MYDEEMAMEIEGEMSRTAKSLGFDVRGYSAEVNQVSFSKTVINIDLDVGINFNSITIAATDDGKYWKGYVTLKPPFSVHKKKNYFKEEFKIKAEAMGDAADLVYSILKSIKDTEKIQASYSLSRVRTK